MKKRIKKSLKTSNGITLIALVVTIIVLLILAGISIAMLSGNNGILQRATIAKENSDRVQIEERIKLAYHAALTGGQGSYTKNTLMDELKKEFETDYDVDDSSNEKWKMKAHGQEVEIPAGETGSLSIEKLKTYFIGKSRVYDVWLNQNGDERDLSNDTANPLEIDGKGVFVVGLSTEKDWILYEEKIYEVLYENPVTAFTKVTNIILSNIDVDYSRLGVHDGVMTTAEGDYPVGADVFKYTGGEVSVRTDDATDSGCLVYHYDIGDDYNDDGWEIRYDNRGIAVRFYAKMLDT